MHIVFKIKAFAVFENYYYSTIGELMQKQYPVFYI